MFTSLLFLLSSFSFISSTSATCPNWTTPFSNKCYYFDSLGNNPGWYDAEAACNCIGGHLASIDNAFENRFVYGNVRGNWTWIGAIQNFNGTWIWSDGHPVKYNSWSQGQDNGFGGCAYMNNGPWYSTSCNMYQNYICQIPNAGLYCPRSKLNPDNTTNYWAYFDSVNACYQFYNATSFDAATFQCDTYLSVHSAQEMTILGDYATSISPNDNIWLGLYDPYQNGSWQWLDGSQYNFTYWDAGEPSLVGTNDCAIFSAQNYKWVSTPCSSLAMGICKTPGKLQTDQSYPQVCDGSNSFSKRGKMNADNGLTKSEAKNQMKISKDARNRI